MKLTWILGIVSAVLLHVFILFFGGLFFPGATESHASATPVDLLDDVEETKPKDEKVDEQKPEEEIEADTDEPPDAADIVKSLEVAPVNDAPALEAASLSAIEAALNGRGGSGEFGEALSFASGGRIGGTGKAGAIGDSQDQVFSMADIDQKPRAVFQTAPSYPSELRAKKTEGSVSVIFVVDAAGKVVDPRIEKSDHPAFDKPALDAIRQWKFEPGVKGGKRVPCKMRQPIRFQPR
jgi:TonB family protein